MLQSTLGVGGTPSRPGCAETARQAGRVDRGAGARRLPGAARTALEHFRGADLARYETLLAGARRVRRHVPGRMRAAGHAGEVPTTARPTDEVHIVALRPAWSIKTRYSTTDILDALATGAHPFESLAALGADLSAYGAAEGDPARRATILRIGAILDSLTGLDPRAYSYRTALGVFGMASKLLRGGHADATDLMDLLALERNLMAIRYKDVVPHEGSGAHGAQFRPGWEWRTGPGGAPWSRHPDALDEPLAPVRDPAAPAATGPSGRVTAPLDKGLLDEALPDDVLPNEVPLNEVLPDEAPLDETPPAEAPPAEAPPAEVLPAEVPPAEVPPAEAPPAEAPLAEAPLAEAPPAEAPPAETPPAETPSNEAKLAEIDMVRTSVREEVPLLRGDDPTALAVPRFAWRLNSDRERGSFEEADTAYDMTRGPRLYTRVGDVVLLGRLAGGAVSWESMPLSEYAVAESVPAAGPQRFDVSGQAYIGIGGVAYRVREIAPGMPWIVHEYSGWPPLPLTRDPAGDWTLKTAKLVPVNMAGNVASDGFLRIANRKFIRIEGTTVEVPRTFIFGEEDIRRFARTEMSELGAADASGIIRLADRTELIEGRYGYYVLQRDGDGGPCYVGEGNGRHWVRFDAARRRWNVVPGEAELEEGGGGLGDQGVASRGMHWLSPANRQGSVRRSSEHSHDSLRRFQEQIGKIDFLQARPLLRTAVDEAFQGIVELNVRRPNRMASGGGDLSTVVSMRRDFYRSTYQTEKWGVLTIQQKQRFVAEKIFNFYAQSLYLPYRFNDALCHEMTDFMTAQLMQSTTLRAKILQIEFRELPGSGLGHAAVLYADNPAVLNRFGRLDETDPVRQRARPRLDRAEFLEFVHANRNRMVLIDPWGLEKIIDFSSMASAEASGQAIDINLRAAGFGEGLSDHYRVAALLPELPRSRSELDVGAKAPSRSLPGSPIRKAFSLSDRRGSSERTKRPPSGPEHGQ